MKVRFTGLEKVEHVYGVFRLPGEVADLSEDRAYDVIARGLAQPVSEKDVQGIFPEKQQIRTRHISVPLLWVIIPTAGKRSEHLDRTLSSLCLEPPENVTICIVLDGVPKKSKTREVIEWWKARLDGPRNPTGIKICVIEHKENEGVNRSRMDAIDMAPLDAVIVEVDDHDQPEPYALSLLSGVFRRKHIQAAFGEQYNVDSKGCIFHRIEPGPYHSKRFYELGPAAPGPCRSYRKRLYKAIGGYREKEWPAGDVWLWLRISAYLAESPEKVEYIRKPLGRYMLAPDSITMDHGNAQKASIRRAAAKFRAGLLFPWFSKRTTTTQLPDFEHVNEHIEGEVTPYHGTVIVVPCYRSRVHVARLLDTMTSQECAATILVSDGDGQYQTTAGMQIQLSENTGFPHACNVGMRYAASADYVCLLNADIEARKGWLDALIDEMEIDPKIAAVGGRQYNPDGSIHSCGSYWSWRTRHFEQAHRNRLPGHQREWQKPHDVVMTTASCVLLRNSALEKVGHFDERYRKGYWEDSDLCMRLCQAGFRLRYTPKSEVIHICGHSGASHHDWYGRNAMLCRERWIETGLVDKYTKAIGDRIHTGNIVACYIVLNEEEYIQASLESIYQFVDRIIIVEGGNNYAVAAGLCGPDKRSTDGTIAKITSFPDPEHKIELIEGKWGDKAEQRSAYTKKLKSGDWMLLMDGDEVFYETGLWRLSALMHQHDIICPGYDLFWNDFSTVGTGRWDDYPQIKAVKWRDGYHYRDHNCPCTKEGSLITNGQRAYRTREKLYAHYSWVKPIEKLRKKFAYYCYQPGAKEQVKSRYIDRVFLGWREHPESVVRAYGTHPFGGGGAEPFKKRHPEPICRRILAAEYEWDRLDSAQEAGCGAEEHIDGE